MYATNVFYEAHIALRKKVLERFDPHNPHILELLRSSPFSEKLFGAAETRDNCNLPCAL